MKYSDLSLTKLLEIIMYQKYSQDHTNINVNPIYKELINRYYQEEKVLLELNETNRKNLYRWLKDKVGYDLLNKLIKESIDKLTGNYKNKHAYFVLDNLSAISNIITLQINESLSDMNKAMVPVSKKETKEIETIFIEFLKSIDHSLEWLNMYYELKSQNRIIYLDELNEREKKEILQRLELDSFDELSNGCTHINGEHFIWLTRKNTTEDFVSLVHEFIHYVVDCKNDVRNRPHILLEFPSIFYELYSHEFLLKQGICEEELNLLKNKRMNNTLYGASGISNVFEVINLYLLNGELNKEIIVEKKKDSVKNMKGLLSNESINAVLNCNANLLNPETLADNEYEDCIRKFITLIDIIYIWYPYVIGTYFANRVLENSDDYTLLKMKFITENCSGLNVSDALEMVNVDVDKLGIISINLGNELK